MDLSKIVDLVAEFNKQRGWHQSHKASRLLIALITEVGELAECYKWEIEGQPLDELRMLNVADELADILIYVICVALVEDIDLEKAVLDKLSRNTLKYPIPST